MGGEARHGVSVVCPPKLPDAATVAKTPVRAQSVLPNDGATQTRRRRNTVGTQTIAQAATLGAPVTSNPLGVTGNG